MDLSGRFSSYFERFGPLLAHKNGLEHLKALKTTFEKSTFWNPAVLDNAYILENKLNKSDIYIMNNM